jgi:hypothetical protein
LLRWVCWSTSLNVLTGAAMHHGVPVLAVYMTYCYCVKRALLPVVCLGGYLGGLGAKYPYAYYSATISMPE